MGVMDFWFVLMLVFSAVAVGGCFGAAVTAAYMTKPADGVRIVCTEGKNAFAYRAPGAVVSVQVFEGGRHVVAVVDEKGRQRVIASDNQALTCDGEQQQGQEW